MEYREIAPGELDRALFRHFERRQEVTKCRRRENGVWVVRDAPFIDDWSEADYAFLVQCLQNTLATGGVVLGAFADGALKGFASVESAPLGKAGDYRDLTCLHVRLSCGAEASGGSFLPGRRSGPVRTAEKSCICRPIRRWRHRRFTRRWAAWRPGSTMRPMWRRSRLTARWSTRCEAP